MTSRALIPVLAAATLLPAASAAHARTLTFGSDLSRPATITHSHGADTLFWQRTLPNGRSGRVPVSGQVLSIRLKGIAHSSPGGPAPDNEIDFRDLKRLSGGRLRTDHSTQPFRMPVDGDPNQVTTFRPTNFCAGKGDFITFADEGGFVPGFYGDGVPFQVLASAPGGVTEMFHRGGSGPTGQNGYVFEPDTARKGVELLMQVTIATGPDAVWYCKGGTKGLPPQLGVRGGTLRVDERHRAGIAVFCHRLRAVRKGGRAVLKPGGACRVSVSVTSGGVKLARGGARIAGHKTGHVSLSLTSQGRRRVRAGGVSAVASVRLKGGGTYRSAVTLARRWRR